MGPLAHGYDIITAGPMMIIWAGLFFIITVVILFFDDYLANIRRVSIVFKKSITIQRLTPIFKAILNRVPFKPVFNRYSRELTSILQDAMKKYRERAFEKFTDKKVMKTFY